MRALRAGVLSVVAVLAVVGVVSAPLAAAATPAMVGWSGVTSQLSDPCPVPVDPVIPSSVDDMEQLVVGTWIRCGSTSILGPVLPGEVGIEIAADGRFFRVYEAADGSLVRAAGLDQEGVWTIIDTTVMNGPGSYQVNLRPVGQGTYSVLPTVLATPPALRIPVMGESVDYLGWAGPAPVPGTPAGVGGGACGQPVDPVTLTSVGQVEQLLVGAWERCGPTSVFGSVREGEVGVEFTADGRFFRLYRGAGASLVRGAGVGEEGTWTVEDTTAMNGPGFYGVSLRGLDGGGWPAQPAFLATPPFVRFVGYPAHTSDYLRSTGPAPASTPQVLPETGVTAWVPLLGAVASITVGLVLVRMTRNDAVDGARRRRGAALGAVRPA